jgi:hypothetical protein
MHAIVRVSAKTRVGLRVSITSNRFSPRSGETQLDIWHPAVSLLPMVVDLMMPSSYSVLIVDQNIYHGDDAREEANFFQIILFRRSRLLPGGFLYL